MAQHFNASGTEIVSQRITYTYDYDIFGGYSQNVLGRLAAVSFANETPGSAEQFAYGCNYSQAGQLMGQRMHIGGLPGGAGTVNLDAVYEWDNHAHRVAYHQ